ncbi:hypothetical protein [Actinoplanes sp. NPDC051859]|uniref:hypothetical protein n=1 Tax=Actinoplanes sp. NPDC051859 TaxID=3363909 RepID=UPI00379DD8AD
MIVSFAYAGATVEIVEAGAILAAARVNPVELLHRAVFPLPVRRAALTVSSVDTPAGPVHVFTAEIGTTAGDLPHKERIRALVLGNDPVGMLLAKRIAAGDPVTTRLVDGVGTAAVAAYRRLGLDRPTGRAPETAVLADAAAGLQATMTSEADGSLVRLRAELPRDEVTPEHLAAMVRLLLQAIVELLPPSTEPLSGRRYTVSRENLPQAPTSTDEVTLDQVGGLADVVAELRQIAVSFRHPAAMARWARGDRRASSCTGHPAPARPCSPEP